MKYKPYPAYKDSGVEWLGAVPEHWEVDRIKRSTISSKNGVWGDEAKQDENDIPCVRVADFDRQRLRVELNEPTIRNIVDSERIGRILIQGDLLLEKSGGGEGQPVGCVVLYDDPIPAVCSNFVARVTTTPGMSPSYWRYVHAATYAVRLNTRSIKQTSGIQNLDASQYFDERAGFPPRLEQTAIATFLDRETAKLDVLIAKQEKLIELLQEKRQALVSHAVTKGLNPDAPMKDSGVEWLGQVPEHWDVTRIGRLFEIQKRIAGELGHDVLSITQRGIQVKDTESNDGQLSMDYSKYQIVEVGDFAMNHMDLITGFIDVAKFPGVTSPDYRVFRLRDSSEADRRYFLAVFQDAYRRKLFFPFGQGSSQLGRWRLPTDAFKEYLILVPPRDEQTNIADFIDQENTKIDTLIEKARQSIELMREHRTALISAAVTGKIDVRETA